MLTKCWQLVVVTFLLLPSTLVEGGHILALFTSAQRSHHLVYGSIVEALLERQHQVTVISTRPLSDTLVGSLEEASENLRYISLELPQVRARKTVIRNGLEKLWAMLEGVDQSGAVLESTALKELMTADKGTKFDLMLLGYSFNDYLLGVAAHFNCSVALIWPTQPISFINSLMGNLEERWYVTQPYDRNQYRGLKALAFGLFEKLIEIMALERMRVIYDDNFPSNRYPSFDEMRRNISIALCNHHSISEGPIAPLVPSIIEVGGIQSRASDKVLPKALQKVFDDPKSQVIYLSLGSRIKWSKLPAKSLQIFMRAFHQLTQSKLITIIWTYDGACSDIESPHIFCGAWWPQSSILAQPQTKLFITHGGKGSLTEALHYGVPMIGLPFFGDQRANLAKMQRQGFGQALDFFTLNETLLFNAIEEILNRNHLYAARVKRFSQLYIDRPLSARDTAVYWLEYVMRHKGAVHMRSPLLDLNFLQYYLIDVYVALLSGYGAFIIICNWLERQLI